MTTGGRWLESQPGFNQLPRAEQYAIWRYASLYFARAARGPVRAFVGGGNPRGTFEEFDHRTAGWKIELGGEARSISSETVDQPSPPKDSVKWYSTPFEIGRTYRIKKPLSYLGHDFADGSLVEFTGDSYDTMKELMRFWFKYWA